MRGTNRREKRDEGEELQNSVPLQKYDSPEGRMD